MPRLRSFRSTKRRNLQNKRTFRLCLAFVFAIASIGVAIVLFFNSHSTRISNILIKGGNGSLDEQVQSIIGKSIAGDYFWFIPKDSAFFFPSRILSKSIPDEFPMIAKISFTRKGLTVVSATIKEREPYAIACDDSDQNNCYYADSNGIIFQTASSTMGTFIVYNIFLPSNTNPMGIDFLDGGRLQAMGSFVGGLSRLGFEDKDITVSTSTDYDLSLVSTRLISSSTPVMHLFINENRPLGDTLTDFSAFWQEFSSKATDTSMLYGLSSVDMRYGDNIIYKTR